MHAYRTHTCGALRLGDAGATARLSGWVHRKRDHGQLLFIDLRDHYGVTQCVIEVSSSLFADIDALRLEAVVSLTGKVVERSPDTVNQNLPTGEIELVIAEFERRRTRLSGAEPAASRHLLRAAAGAAAIQAIAYGGRVRPVFPNRAVLPGRSRPRRPLPRRVLSARFRDVVRDPGGRVRRNRAGIARHLRGVRRLS